jgi:hypothetical protein
MSEISWLAKTWSRQCDSDCVRLSNGTMQSWPTFWKNLLPPATYHVRSDCSVIILKTTAYYISAVCFHILFKNNPHRPWIPRSLEFHGNQGSFLGGKAARAWSWPLTSFHCWNQEWVELFLYAFCNPSRHGQWQFYLYLYLFLSIDVCF